jgi:hypothetical protein
MSLTTELVLSFCAGAVPLAAYRVRRSGGWNELSGYVVALVIGMIAVPPATLLFGFPVVARFSDMSTEGFLRLVTYALQRRGFVICSLIIALSAGVGTTLGAESGRKQRLANGDRRTSYASWVLAPIMGAALVGGMAALFLAGSLEGQWYNIRSEWMNQPEELQRLLDYAHGKADPATERLLQRELERSRTAASGGGSQDPKF